MSLDAAGAPTTVGVYVDAATSPRPEVTVYGSGAAVPTKLANGVKVTTPEELTAYVPTLGTVTDVAEQFGETSGVEAATLHNFTEEFVNGSPERAVSFVKMLCVWTAPCTPELVSGDAVPGCAVGIFQFIATYSKRSKSQKYGFDSSVLTRNRSVTSKETDV